MGLFGKLFGPGEPEIFCKSCLKCSIYDARREAERDRKLGIKYYSMPESHLIAASCHYQPTERGGCESFSSKAGFRSFIIDSLRDAVTPKPGSVVVCDLRLFMLPGVDHSGIVNRYGMW